MLFCHFSGTMESMTASVPLSWEVSVTKRSRLSGWCANGLVESNVGSASQGHSITLNCFPAPIMSSFPSKGDPPFLLEVDAKLGLALNSCSWRFSTSLRSDLSSWACSLTVFCNSRRAWITEWISTISNENCGQLFTPPTVSWLNLCQLQIQSQIQNQEEVQGASLWDWWMRTIVPQLQLFIRQAARGFRNSPLN